MIRRFGRHEVEEGRIPRQEGVQIGRGTFEDREGLVQRAGEGAAEREGAQRSRGWWRRSRTVAAECGRRSRCCRAAGGRRRRRREEEVGVRAGFDARDGRERVRPAREREVGPRVRKKSSSTHIQREERDYGQSQTVCDAFELLDGAQGGGDAEVEVLSGGDEAVHGCDGGLLRCSVPVGGGARG